MFEAGWFARGGLAKRASEAPFLLFRVLGGVSGQARVVVVFALVVVAWVPVG
jgi:hypothetical protein